MKKFIAALALTVTVAQFAPVVASAHGARHVLCQGAMYKRLGGEINCGGG